MGVLIPIMTLLEMGFWCGKRFEKHQSQLKPLHASMERKEKEINDLKNSTMEGCLNVESARRGKGVKGHSLKVYFAHY